MTLASPVRIYLAGRICLETEAMIDQHAFPGRQGRLAFALLVCERGRPVSRSELADVLWPEEPASAWDSALSAIVSKLRGLLSRAGLDGPKALQGTGGAYELRLPATAWVDLEAASDAIHEAEAALRLGDPARAYGPSAVAHHIARRPLFAGEEGGGHWAELRRAKHRSILIRALEVRTQVYLWNGELPLALEAAREAVALEPLRETGHQLLMRAHAAAGNTAEALKAWEYCRRLIAGELGVSPSPPTRAVYEEILSGLRNDA
jgi:DNA-binding SARP family transcriptional activator